MLIVVGVALLHLSSKPMSIVDALRTASRVLLPRQMPLVDLRYTTANVDKAALQHLEADAMVIAVLSGPRSHRQIHGVATAMVIDVAALAHRPLLATAVPRWHY
jgi:hypothetical protein